jgi:Insertion element 4 transposase N-terminal/Transposase DDE domain
MSLTQELETLPDALVPAEFGRFRQHIDPAWIEEALAATGTATIRRRRLPADQVIWIVLGMALMRNESIERVIETLDLALPSKNDEPTAKSAIVQARRRLGEEPMAYLFATTADRWAHQSADRHRWHGLALYGIDGTTLRVPDSLQNWEAFGGQCGNGTRGGSAYPQVRLVTLMTLRSHLLANTYFGPYGTGETTYADGFWAEMPDHSLMIGDRNFLILDDLCALSRSGQDKHWLVPAKSTTRLRRVQRLGKNDWLVEVELSEQTRKKYPDLPQVVLARAITYHKRGFAKRTLLTSMRDIERFSTAGIIALYHERWELELGNDEIKTHLLDRQEAIRSRTPVGVRQEIWGILLAYNLVRVEMERAADEAEVEPTQISFVNAVALIRYCWLLSTTRPLAPGRIPERLLSLRRQLKLLLLPLRRSERRAPRVVKIKMSKFKRKRPTTRGRK